MGSEISLVEVVMFVFKKDDTSHNDFIENLDLTYPDWEQSTKELPKPQNSSFFDDTMKFIKDCYGFKFNFVGETFDSEWASGLDFEYSEASLGGDVFEGFEEQLIEYGNKLIEECDAKQEYMKEPKSTKIARFVTIWEYNSWIDSYNNEYESDWNLLGLLRINKSLIDKESK